MLEMPSILLMVTALMRSQTLNQTRTKKRPSAKLQRACTWAGYGWVAFFCGLCGSPRRRSRLLQPPGHSLSWRVRGNFTENAVSKFSVLAERETLLHRLGSKLNRTVLNSCGNSLSVPQIITRDFLRNTKQVIQDFFRNTKQVIQFFLETPNK